jgi:hypothetical protein
MSAYDLFVRPLVPGDSVGVQRAFPGRSSDRHDRDEREALIGVDGRIAHGHARTGSALLVAHGRIQFDEDNSPAIDVHADSSTQPCPSTHRTGLPAASSTRPSSSAGRLAPQSLRPVSASSAASG